MLNAHAPVAVVCHDAGAANIVIAALKATGREDWRACMGGPAVNIWQSAFPGIPVYATPAQALEGAEFLVSGTGWASSLEHNARCIAHDRAIRNVAVLDHWVNYAERFVRQGKTVLPDEFWVTDAEAEDLAKKCFPGATVVRVANYYVGTQLGKIRSVAKPSIPELLYVLEPMRGDWGRGVQGEFQALDYFVCKLAMLNLPRDLVIRLRPHPSDPPGKYDAWIAGQQGLRLQTDMDQEIYHSLGRATWVAGCESFAMALALQAGRSVICTLPPWAPACCLPQKDIIHLAGLK